MEACDPDYPIFWHLVHGPRADALTWLGRYDEAAAAARAALESHRRIGRPLALGGLMACALGLAALADAAAGVDHDQAGELLHHAREVAARGVPRLRVMGPEGQAWLLRAEAEAARLAGRSEVDAWRAAHEAFGFGHAYETARTGRRLAEALLITGGRGAREEATELLRAGREIAQRLQARPLRQALDALAARHRLGLGGGAAGPRVLTPREEEVMRLVAEGLTNREISVRLFISEKTASVHVSNVLAKLGASGRAEAVAVAHRRGLLGS